MNSLKSQMFMSEEANANINLVYQIQMQFFLLQSPFLVFQSPPYRRYFPLYSLIEPSFPYTYSSSKSPLEQLSHQPSSSAFLNDNLSGNTVQRFTPHKCGHNGRYNAFNVEVAAFLQIFWSLPSSQCVCEVFLRDGNFVEYHYNGPSKQLNHIQQIRGGISPWKAFLLFPISKILVAKSQQSLISYFTSSAIQVCG